MSPRRSSRARTTQPTPSGPQHSNSSSSSMTSSRPSQKPPSQRSSVAARSQSSEDRDASAKLQSRRTRSSHEDVNAELTNAVEDDIEDEGEEEEVTRCICGNQEYPGLPLSTNEPSRGGSKGDSDSAAFAEDTTGWFIQCDGCKVWQHGGCVGIMDAATSPEEYFCEQCRTELHRITTTVNGRKYSLYIPVQESKSGPTLPTPPAKKHSKRSKENGKAGRVNAEGASKGRRSTMNSRENRDAALEEAQLRIAIEESKRDGGTASTSTGVRKGKRSRSASEDGNEGTKRQRTESGSASSIPQNKAQRRASNSEEEAEKPERAKNIRGAAARNHRNKELRDREAQKERERAEVKKKKGRAERDDAPESGSATPEPPSRTISAKGNKPTTILSTPAVPDLPPPKSSHKKTGRPPARRGRVGRNQYTKDRDLPHQNETHRKSSPVPSNSSQNADGGTPRANGITNGYGDTNGLGKPSKPRHLNPNKTTMNDMKRRVANILEFISVTQVQMAGATVASSTTKSSTSTNTPPNSHENGNGSRDVHDSSRKDGISEKSVCAALSDLNAIDEQTFGALSSLEMMDVLTRQLLRWQGEYGKWDK